MAVMRPYLQILYRVEMAHSPPLHTGSWCKEAGDRRDACAMASMSAAAASFFAEASRADDGGAGDAGMTAKQAVVQARRRVLEALPAAGGDAEMPVARNWVAGSSAAPAAGQWIEDLAPATGQQVRFCGCWEVGATLADSSPPSPPLDCCALVCPRRVMHAQAHVRGMGCVVAHAHRRALAGRGWGTTRLLCS